MALEIDNAALSKSDILSSLVAASSSDEDTVQIRRTTKKRINLSDDENSDASQNFSSLNASRNIENDAEQSSSEQSNDEAILTFSKTKKKKQRRILIQKDSDDSAEEDDPKERSTSRSSEQENDDHGSQQRKILDSLRSENGYDAESSENEAPVGGRSSTASYRSDDEEEAGLVKKGKQKSRPKGPERKSKKACLAAMQEERMKMISESQRMVRESRASLPYHKPRQRSLKEFLSARPKPNPLLRGAKFQQVDISIIGKDLEEREKLAEEFYKPESDKEEEVEESWTPPSKTPEPPSNEDSVLKVLQNTREELKKNIEANTLNILKCSSEVKEDSESDKLKTQDDMIAAEIKDVRETMELDQPAPEETVLVAETIEKSNDFNAEVESMEAEVSTSPKKIDTVNEEVLVPEKMITPISSSTETSNQDSKSSNKETEPVEKAKPPVLTKLTLAADAGDACLTPSDALKDDDIFLKPAAIKTPVEEKNTPTEENDSCDFHLFFEDSEDIYKNNQLESNDKSTSEIPPKAVKSPEKEEKESEKPELDLKRLYNSSEIFSSDEEDTPKPKKEELKGKAKILANLKLSSGPIRLKGGPNEVIDLDDDVEPTSGVKNLMQRFIRQATTGQRKTPIEKKGGLLSMIKSGEQLEDTPDHHAKPGQRMSLLKSELRDAIAKQRDEEFKKRQNEYQMYEDETEGLLGDDGDDCKMLSDEEEAELEKTGLDMEEEEGSTESEPELEDDVVLKDDPKPRSEFMDDEAEESEPEENENDEEELQEKPAILQENDQGEEEEEDEDSDSSEEEEEDDAKTQSTPSGGKRTFQRIQIAEDSDEENDNKDGTKTEQNKDEAPDTQPLEEEDDQTDDKSFSSSFNKSLNLTMLETSGSDLERHSAHLCEVTQLERDNNERFKPRGITQLLQESSFELCTNSDEEKKVRGFSKGLSVDLFQSTESLTENIKDICSAQANLPRSLNKLFQRTDSLREDIGALCSGQFITQVDKTQSISKEMNNLIGDSQTQGVDFADLCSGQFITQADTPKELDKLIGDTQTQADNLADLCSGQFVTQKDMPKDLDKLLGNSNTQFDNLADMCSGQFVTQIKTQNDMSKELNQLVNGSSTVPDNLADLCSGQFVTQTSQALNQGENKTSSLDSQAIQAEEAVNSNKDNKPEASLVMRIVSDDEDEEPDFKEKKIKKLKRKRKLEFSDDEEEEEDANSIINSESEEEGVDQETSYVDYDSEENEIIVSAPQEKIKPKHFFENEAELSESEWGSADEDEKGLDQLEEELGDKEDFDESEVKEALGKIHARRMLDDDKQDVRLFQEAFLEDGDLHSEGGGRQRLFRWKNVDDGDWAAGANPNLSGDEGGDEDDEEESTWRTARLERETWLQENKDKAGGDVLEEDNSQLLMLGRSLLAKMGNNRIKNGNNNSKPAPEIKKTDQSPGKVIRQSLQRKSGSFLARRSISVTRVVAMTGGDGDGTTIKSTTSRGNFVFCTVSPSNVKAAGAPDAMEVEPSDQSPAPVKKRPKASKPGTKGPATKKKRVSSSVFQHLQ